MGVFEAFENDLRDALAHLYDPTYHPPAELWEVTGCTPKQGVRALQAVLIQEIENLQPAPDVPPSARSRLIYDVLSCRYLQGLTQEEAAKRIGFTARTLRRVQHQGVNLLAQRLWERSDTPQHGELTDRSPPNETVPLDDDQETVWFSQLKEELTSLQESSSGQLADVIEIINGALSVSGAVTAKHKVQVLADLPDAVLLTTGHASILRQILIRGIGKIVEHMQGGDISIAVEEDEDHICICITGAPVDTREDLFSPFIQEAAMSQGGSFEVVQEEQQVIYQIKVPVAANITVLVVDDNTDLVHFYRRYVAGTKYEIVHLAEGQQLFETINEVAPHIIVLDVMLPGVDGWELLTHLHEHPHTRSIPVIVCSVVRGEEMALALGATLYLQKPIRSRQLIGALDQALKINMSSATASSANDLTA